MATELSPAIISVHQSIIFPVTVARRQLTILSYSSAQKIVFHFYGQLAKQKKEPHLEMFCALVWASSSHIHHVSRMKIWGSSNSAIKFVGSCARWTIREGLQHNDATWCHNLSMKWNHHIVISLRCTWSTNYINYIYTYIWHNVVYFCRGTISTIHDTWDSITSWEWVFTLGASRKKCQIRSISGTSSLPSSIFQSSQAPSADLKRLKSLGDDPKSLASRKGEGKHPKPPAFPTRRCQHFAANIGGQHMQLGKLGDVLWVLVILWMGCLKSWKDRK